MIDAANAMGASLAQTSMPVMPGNAWNGLVQPFWILPALASSRVNGHRKTDGRRPLPASPTIGARPSDPGS